MRPKLQRVAFQLRVRAGAEAAYDEAHRHVWPELRRELDAFGVRHYSIFRRERELFLFMLVPDFDRLLRKLATSEIDRQWQRTMAPLLEPVPNLKPEEPFAMMAEVFYMEGGEEPEAGEAGVLEESEHGD